MARLNEPVVAPDGLEILRRRFLRQNRDIARINSTQSLRIRSLENECARMLSENLQLRGRILQLESELRESSAQRIADHAIEIKEKMEAQLLEWGTMLASLGNEPIPRNRSPRAHKRLRLEPSPRRRSSPLQCQRREPSREMMREMEDVATQEGRLAPIWENRPCPRETLSCDEILALREEVDEVSDSPDLGPPPTSRYMHEDPVKLDLPTRSTHVAMEDASRDDSMTEADAAQMSRPNTNTTYTSSDEDFVEHGKDTDELKATLKRKASTDEDKDFGRGLPQFTINSSLSKLQVAKDSDTMSNQPKRPIKSLPTGRKDSKPTALGTVATGVQRKPLGIKNSNDAFASPKKAGKPTPVDEVAKAKAESKRADGAKARPKAKKDAPANTPIQIPAPLPQEMSVVSMAIDPTTLSAEPNLNTPFSPESSMSRDDAKDTPPPAHISSLGETARASRRARPAVSYAEPNLRDKMRRPTKELFDAVSGEGKNIRRHSQSKRDELPSTLGSTSISGSEEKSQVWRDFPRNPITEATEANPAAGIAASPLAMKVSKDATETIPISLVTERKNRASGAGADETTKSKNGSRKLEDIVAREAELSKRSEGLDVYDFPTPTSEDGGRQADTSTRKLGGSRQSRARRLSSIAGEEISRAGLEDGDDTKFSATKAASRKRASMAAPKKSKMSLGASELEHSAEGDSQASILSTSSTEAADGKDRGAMRRRSMMI